MNAKVTAIEYFTAPILDCGGTKKVGLVLRDPNKEVFECIKSSLANKEKVFAIMISRNRQSKNETA